MGTTPVSGSTPTLLRPTSTPRDLETRRNFTRQVPRHVAAQRGGRRLRPHAFRTARQKSRAEPAHLILIDQSGLQLSPTRGRTRAPRGQRPVLKAIRSRQKISVMAALTVSPKTMRHNQMYRSLIDTNFDTTRVIQFLRDLLAQIRGKIIVVWDNAPIHKSRLVRDFVARHPRLTV